MPRRPDRLATGLLAVAALVVLTVAATRSPHRAAADVDPSPRAPRTAGAPTTTTATAPARQASGRRLDTLVLTLDRLDAYRTSATATGIDFRAAPTNSDRNLRVVAWDPDVAPSRDQEACATWRTETDGFSQEGFTLRTRQDGDRWRAITVTKNTFYAAFGYLNVHTWDSTRATAIATVGHARIDGLYRTPTLVVPLPWRVCARAVGDEIHVKAWSARQAEPSWSDPRYAATIRLPAGWDIAGRPGWYAGHLPPGGSTTATAIGVRSLDPASAAPHG